MRREFDRLDREADVLAHLHYEDEDMPIVEPCRVPRPAADARLGRQIANQAARAGTEDDRSNQLQARYGGEW